MRIKLTKELKAKLVRFGVESLHAPGPTSFPKETILEVPCSIKWMQIEHSLIMGAFSYAVSGFYFACRIGRYCSIGEDVQIGRQDHPTSWLSTSPFQYLGQPLFDVGDEFADAEQFKNYKCHLAGKVPSTKLKITKLGHDVWIGHGAFIRAGVQIGHGAVIGAHTVVVKDIPPYAIVVGNPGVIKRYRFQEDVIERLLELKWWDYAPWQLGELQFNEPLKAMDELQERIASMKPYCPKTLHMGRLAGSRHA